jgi:hypothetical protein
MLANIKRLVDRLELSQAKAMMPLFEAISNANDSIEEHKDGFTRHSIRMSILIGSLHANDPELRQPGRFPCEVAK